MYDPARGYPSVVPYILYADPAAAIDWLVDVLGLEHALRVAMPDGSIGHAELTLGNQVVMIGLAGGERFGTVSSITLVFVEDVDATCARARCRWIAHRATRGSALGSPPSRHRRSGGPTLGGHQAPPRCHARCVGG